MEPPEAIAADKRRARYHFTLVVEEVSLVDASTTGGLDRCRASGRVERVHRKPRFRRERGGSIPRAGERFSVRVGCWNEEAAPEPPGPNRLHYGGTEEPGRIEVWGSVIDGEFVVFQFEKPA